jgi:hypothetical protein
MKFILILAVAAISTSVIAQPTFTASNFNPVIGEMSAGSTFDSTSFTVPVLGANVTWNYNGLVLESSNPPAVAFVNPSTTSYASSFTSANAATGSNNAYNYYLFNSSGQYHYGEGSPSQVVSEDDPGTLYTFPFTYGFSLTDNMHANFIANGFPAERVGTITTVADGYGTLVLPNGTYNNVLHVTQRWEFDEIVDYGSTTMIGTFIYKYSYWFRPNTHFPLLYYGQFGIVNGFTEIWTQLGGYIDASYVGIEENENGLQCSYFPNPVTNGQVNLTWNDQQNNTMIITIYNLIGDVVYSNTLINMTGKNNNILDLSMLNAGAYMMHVVGDKNEFSGKIIIE